MFDNEKIRAAIAASEEAENVVKAYRRVWMVEMSRGLQAAVDELGGLPEGWELSFTLPEWVMLWHEEGMTEIDTGWSDRLGCVVFTVDAVGEYLTLAEALAVAALPRAERPQVDP